MLKHQQFKDSGSEDTEQKRLEYLYLDERDNEEENSLNGDEGEIKGVTYVSASVIPLFIL